MSVGKSESNVNNSVAILAAVKSLDQMKIRTLVLFGVHAAGGTAGDCPGSLGLRPLLV